MIAILALGRTSGLYAFAVVFVSGIISQRLTTRAARSRLRQGA